MRYKTFFENLLGGRGQIYGERVFIEQCQIAFISILLSKTSVAILNHKLFLREVALSAAETTRLNVLVHLREIEVIVMSMSF